MFFLCKEIFCYYILSFNFLNINMIKNTLVIGSGKGGVGKSTLAANLSVALSKLNRLKVGLLDADIYGPSIPNMFGVFEKPSTNNQKKIVPHEKYGLKFMSIGNMIPNESAVIWRGVMASNAIKQLIRDVDWGELDFLIIDLPPGTGDIQISLSQTLEISGAVIVSSPQEISLIDVRKAINMFKKVSIPILGLVENFCYIPNPNGDKNFIFGQGNVLKESKKNKISYLGEVPIISEISILSDDGKPPAFDESSESFIYFKKISENILKNFNNLDKTKVEIS